MNCRLFAYFFVLDFRGNQNEYIWCVWWCEYIAHTDCDRPTPNFGSDKNLAAILNKNIVLHRLADIHRAPSEAGACVQCFLFHSTSSLASSFLFVCDFASRTKEKEFVFEFLRIVCERFEETMSANPPKSNPCPRHKELYVYEILVSDLRNLCFIIDDRNLWEELAMKMGYQTKDTEVSTRMDATDETTYSQIQPNSFAGIAFNLSLPCPILRLPVSK